MNTDFYKFVDKNSDTLIITFNGLRRKLIINNKYRIDNNLKPMSFLMNRSLDKTNFDVLYLRDKYQCYYLFGFDINNSHCTYKNYVDVIMNVINKKKYKKIITIGLSSGGYGVLLTILRSELKNIVDEVHSFSPQTNCFNSFNRGRFIKTYNIQCNAMINYIPEKYEVEDIFNMFDLTYDVNNYTDGKCKIFIYVHKQNIMDMNFIEPIHFDEKFDFIDGTNIKYDQIHKQKNLFILNFKNGDTHNTIGNVHKHLINNI